MNILDTAPGIDVHWLADMLAIRRMRRRRTTSKHWFAILHADEEPRAITARLPTLHDRF